MMERPPKHHEYEHGEAFGSFELDLTTGEARYSPGLRRILGAPDDVALSSGLVLERVHPEDREVLERARRRSGRGDEPMRFEVRVRRFDDTERGVRGWA